MELFNPFHWAWPQWSVLVIIFLRLTICAASNGKPMVDPETKEPQKYNFAIALCHFLIMLFLLTFGGFFR